MEEEYQNVFERVNTQLAEVREQFKPLTIKLNKDIDTLLKEDSTLVAILGKPLSLETANTLLNSCFPDCPAVNRAKLNLVNEISIINTNVVQWLNVPFNSLLEKFSENSNRETAKGLLEVTSKIAVELLKALSEVNTESFVELSKQTFIFRSLYLKLLNDDIGNIKLYLKSNPLESGGYVTLTETFTEEFLKEHTCPNGDYLLVESFKDVFDNLIDEVKEIDERLSNNPTNLFFFNKYLGERMSMIMINMAYVNTLASFVPAPQLKEE